METLDKIIAYIKSDEVWILQVFLIVFAALVIDYIQKRILRRLQLRLEKTSSLWDDAFIYALIVPVSVVIWLVGLSFALQLVNFDYVETIRTVGIIICIAWSLVRFISHAEQNIINQQKIRGVKVDRTTANAVTQLLRVSIIITASLVVLQTMGFNISAILAFGGIGGIAVGFAAKDLLANFFGGLMIYLDRPFAIGDWVRSPDRNIEGTIEKIGWRLTVIRTFDKRPLYIPNSVFASIAVENPSRMTNRRIYETIGVRYDDVESLPGILQDIKQMLVDHPEIDKGQTMIVNFNQFAPSSLDFFIYTFTHTTEWIKFHEIKQDVLFRITAIIHSHGAEIAYPTSTVHLAGQNLPDNLQKDH